MITLVSGIALTPVWWLLSPDRALVTALTVTAGHLISGLAFSCDLDVYSTEYKRWGPLRVIWWPYQKMIFHRSIISHGLVIGPLFRLAYFTLLLYGVLWLTMTPLGYGDTLGRLRGEAEALLRANGGQSWAFLWGFVTGGAAHTFPDWITTSAKRARREWLR